MNKRQRKKRLKIIAERVKFINSHMFISGRMNGKTLLWGRIQEACYSKKYKPYKQLKRFFKKLNIGIDLSNGFDYTAISMFLKEKGYYKCIKSIVKDGHEASTVILDELHDYKNRLIK